MSSDGDEAVKRLLSSMGVETQLDAEIVEIKEVESKADKKKSKKETKKRQLRQEGEVLRAFFCSDKYIPAAPDEYEGHYPGNQNNPILIPYGEKIVHES